jgi:hypothetical protein
LGPARRGRRGRTLLSDLLGPPRGPPSSGGSALTVTQLEQWELLGDGRWGLDRRVLLAVVEHHLRLA